MANVPQWAQPLVDQAEQQYNLPQGILAPMAQQESSWNPRAVSKMGAQGIMQLMPATAQHLGVRDVFDPAQNIDGGARYMRELIDQYGGNVEAAKAHYNGGGAAGKAVAAGFQPPSAETRDYLHRTAYSPQQQGQQQPMADYPQSAPRGQFAYLPLPSGALYKYDAAKYPNPQDALMQATYEVPDEFGPPPPPHEQGFGDALMKGVKGMGMSTMTGIQSLFDPNGAALQAMKNSESLEKQYGSSGNWDAVSNAYENNGVVGAMKEFVADYVTHPLAENAPQMAAMVAASRLGAMAGGALGGPLGAGAGALIGGALSFAPSILSSNIERQAEQQKKDNPDGSIDVSMGKALAATAGQTVANVGAMRFAGGALMKPFMKMAETEGVATAEQALAAKALARQKELYQQGFGQVRDAAGAITGDVAKSATGAFAKGAAQGAAIMPADMVMQTVLARWQAGQPLLDGDALKEYGETAAGAAGVGAAFGGLGHFGQPAAARAQIEKVEQQREAMVQQQYLADQQKPMGTTSPWIPEAQQPGAQMAQQFRSQEEQQRYDNWLQARQVFSAPEMHEANTQDPTTFRPLGAAPPVSENPQPKAQATPAQYNLYWGIPELRERLPPDEYQRRVLQEARQAAEEHAQAIAATQTQGSQPTPKPAWVQAYNHDEQQREHEFNQFLANMVEDRRPAADAAEQQAQALDMTSRSADALQARMASPLFQLGVAAGDPLLVTKLHAALGSGSLLDEISNFYNQNQIVRTTYAGQKLKLADVAPGVSSLSSDDVAAMPPEAARLALNARIAERRAAGDTKEQLAPLIELKNTLNQGIRLRDKLREGTLDTTVAKALGGMHDMTAGDLANINPDALNTILTSRQQALEAKRMQLLDPNVELNDPQTGLLTQEGQDAVENEIRLNQIKSVLQLLQKSREIDPSENLATAIVHSLSAEKAPKTSAPTSPTVEPSKVPERMMMLMPDQTSTNGPQQSKIMAVQIDERTHRQQQIRKWGERIPTILTELYDVSNALHRGDFMESINSPAGKAKEAEREILKLGASKRAATPFGEKLGAAMERTAPAVWGPKRTTSAEMGNENFRRGIQYGESAKGLMEARRQNLLANLRSAVIAEAAEKHALEGGRLPRDQALAAILPSINRLNELLDKAAESTRPEIDATVAKMRQDMAPGSPELAKPIVRRAPREIRLGQQFWQPERTRQQARDETWDRIGQTLPNPMPPELRDVLEKLHAELAPDWRRAEVGEAEVGGLHQPTAGSERLLEVANALLAHPTPELISEARQTLREEQEARSSHEQQGQLFGADATPVKNPIEDIGTNTRTPVKEVHSPFLARASAHQFQRFLNSKAAEEMRKATMSLDQFERLSQQGEGQHTELSRHIDALRTVLAAIQDSMNALKLGEKGPLFTTEAEGHGATPEEAGMDYVQELARRRDHAEALINQTIEQLKKRQQVLLDETGKAYKTVLKTRGERSLGSRVERTPDELPKLKEQQAAAERMLNAVQSMSQGVHAYEASRVKLAAEERMAKVGTTSVKVTHVQRGTRWPRDENGRMRPLDWQNESGEPIPGHRTETFEHSAYDPATDPFKGTEHDIAVPPNTDEPLVGRISYAQRIADLTAQEKELQGKIERSKSFKNKAALADKLKEVQDERADLERTNKLPFKDEVRAGGQHGLPVDKLRVRGDKNLPRRPAVGAVGAEMGDEPGRVRRANKKNSEAAEIPETKGRVPGIGELETPPQLLNSNLDRPVLGGEGTNADAVKASMEAQAAAKTKRAKPKKGGLSRMSDTQPMTAVSFDDARTAVQRMQGELGNTATIYHGRDANDCPPDLAAEMHAEGKDPGDQKGWISPDGKRIWINNAAHADMADIEETLAHEIIGHRQAIPIIDKAWEARGGFHGFARALDGSAGGGVDRLLKDLGIDQQYKGEDLDTKAKEAIAAMEGRRPNEGMTDTIRRAWKEVVGAVRDWLRQMGLMSFANAKDYDIYHMLRQARNADHLRDVNLGDKGLASAYVGPKGNEDLQTRLFGGPVDAKDRIKAALGFGKKQMLMTQTQYVDHHAGILRAIDPSIRGAVGRTLAQDVGALESVRALEYATHAQMFINQAMVSGLPRFVHKVLKWAAHGGQEHGMDTVEAGGVGPSMKYVMEPIVKGNRSVAALSEYLAYERAVHLHDGWNVLFGGKENKGEAFYAANKDKIEKALAEGRADPVFQEMRKRYAEYNKGLLKFAQDCRWLSPEFVRGLDAENYAGYYRADDEDNVYANFGDKKMFVGNLREQPDLKELLGDDGPIMDISASMIKNTNLIIRNALRNLGTMKTANALHDLGAGTLGSAVSPKRGANFIHFNDWDAETGAQVQRSFQVDTDAPGSKLSGMDIPVASIVSGLEGTVSVTGPLINALGAPAGLFRKATIRNPLYAFWRTPIRESTALWGTSGANFMPVVSAMRDIAKTMAHGNKTFDRTSELGINSTFVFTGDPKKLTQEIAGLNNAKGPMGKLLAMADHAAIAAEASARNVMFDSYLKQGLNEEEAAHAVIKNGIDFTQRGKSPAISILRRLVPFAGAQITSLDALQKAARGNLPYSDRLNIQKKMLTRGLMLAGATMTYALLMKDNKAYQNAPDEEKYGNFFIPINDQFMIKAPIPWEYGYVFKVLPEALIGHFLGDTTNTELAQQLISMAGNVAPSVIPTTLRPFIEAGTNHDFFSGRPIISDEQAKKTQGERFTPNTTEIAKKLSGEWANVGGQSYGISPIMLEHFVKSYVAPMGFAAVQFASMPFEDNRPARKLSEMPIIGSTFQDSDGARYLNMMEDAASKATQQKAVYDAMIKQQRFGDASDLLNDPDKSQLFAFAKPAEKWEQADQKLRQMEGQFRFMQGMSPDEKQAAIRQVERQRIELARQYRPVFPGQ
jgi:hypothetical protein